jgi:tripartite-type tricarboxylate transporter receptor subunit TctC
MPAQAGIHATLLVQRDAKRSPSPEIPRVDETGPPEFYVSTWHSLWVPKGTPKPVVATLNRAVVDALTDPTVRRRPRRFRRESN